LRCAAFTRACLLGTLSGEKAELRCRRRHHCQQCSHHERAEPLHIPHTSHAHTDTNDRHTTTRAIAATDWQSQQALSQKKYEMRSWRAPHGAHTRARASPTPRQTSLISSGDYGAGDAPTAQPACALAPLTYLASCRHTLRRCARGCVASHGPHIEPLRRQVHLIALLVVRGIAAGWHPRHVRLRHVVGGVGGGIGCGVGCTASLRRRHSFGWLLQTLLLGRRLAARRRGRVPVGSSSLSLRSDAYLWLRRLYVRGEIRGRRRGRGS